MWANTYFTFVTDIAFYFFYDKTHKPYAVVIHMYFHVVWRGTPSIRIPNIGLVSLVQNRIPNCCPDKSNKFRFDSSCVAGLPPDELAIGIGCIWHTNCYPILSSIIMTPTNSIFIFSVGFCYMSKMSLMNRQHSFLPLNLNLLLMSSWNICCIWFTAFV